MDKIFYDLTNPQKSIWLTNQMYPNTSIGNICGSVFFEEKVDFEILEKSINSFVQKNDSFRLKLEHTENGVNQYVSDFAPFSIEIKKIKSKEDVAGLEKELVSTPFPLVGSLLFYFVCFEFPDGTGGFIMNAHHLIVDAWTVGITLNGIIEHYEYFTGKREKVTEKYPSYVDYINSEKDYVESEKYQKDKEFWANTFETIPEAVTIPGSIQNDSSKLDCNANRQVFTLPKELTSAINSYCKENHSSAFNFFMAILALYTSNVTGKDELVIGSPILNRNNFKDKNTTGMFISTIPFKISINFDESFTNLMSKTAGDFMQIYRHQKYPYQHLLESLRAENSSIPNLYNLILSYQNIRSDKQTSKVKFHTRWVQNKCISENIDIHLYDFDDTGNLQIIYDYLTSKYTNADIEDLNSRIIYIAEQIMENHNVLIKDIEIVTPSEKEQILNILDSRNVNFPRDKTIVGLFEEQVQKTPNNVAVKISNSSITYKELNERANQLARFLVNNGTGHGDIVALRLDKSIEMIVSIIAIIKAGACYLPINLAYPDDRVNFMLSDSNAKFMLCDRKTESQINVNLKKYIVDFDNNDIYAGDNSNLNLNIKPDDLLYIIYTSGSTGTPKGAMISHKNVVRLMKNDAFLFKFSENDVWTMFHAVSFDFSVWEMYGALLYGAKLVLVPDMVAKDPSVYLKLLRDEQVTVLNQTPTYFYNLLNSEMKFDDANLKLRYIVYGGEALKPTAIAMWKEKYPSCKLINMYGITETTVHVTFKELSSDDLKLATSNIGKPIPTLGIMLLNKHLKLVPKGVQGEICVLGDGLFKGYLNRPDLNQTKLIPNPYNEQELMYRSGDSAILRDNLELEYTGRIDTQVKIRGFRVELGEIEEKILEDSSIKSCVVTTKNLDGSHDLLCAYYVKTGNIDISKIKTSLSKKLPNYMIPQYFIELSSLPYNYNGKIDLKKLPNPEVSSDKEIVLPRNTIDEKLVNIFKNILNVSAMSIDDSFFDLGGDSLSAINLCAQIQNEFNVQIYVKDILENPEIRDLSDIISKHIDTFKSVVITPTAKADYYPVSSAQKRIFFASQVAGDSNTSYNLPGSIIFEGKPDIKKIENCIQVLINRHEALRTCFEIREGTVVQRILDNINFKLDIIENQNFDSLHAIFNDFVKPFDLSKAPLFRAKLVSFSNYKHALFIDMHHIISDGTSLSILVNELCKLYNEELLPKLKITYKDYSAFENERLASGELKDAQEFWLHQFEGEIPVLNLPTKTSRPAVQTFEGKKVYASISSEITNKINSTAQTLGVTPYMLMLGAYYVLLAKYTSQDELVVGSPVIGRDVAETYNIIGMFVNTLPLKGTIDNEKTFKEFVLKLRDNLLNCYKYQTYPFDELVNKLEIRRDTSRNPLFDTMFVYQNNGYEDIHFSNIKSEYYIPDTGISKFDLSLEVVPNKDGAKLTFEYATKLFNEDFILNMSCHYINILNSVLDNVDTKICQIDMLSKEEKHKILYEFNNTKMDYPKGKTISQLFEEQAEKTPSHVAVVFEDTQLTYKELNEKVNSLAHYLRNNGIDRNTLVGIMVSRSIEMIIAILAVLKAGGAYIPIDPTYPKDRIKYMLENSNSKLLLTQKHLVDNINFSKKTCIDLSNESIYSLSKENLTNINEPEDLSYVIYTSGSTGMPKGVALKHKALSNLTAYCNNYIEYLKNPSYISIASITTISFDIFIFETLISLQKGLKLVIANENEQTTPKALSNLIIKHNVQAIQATPSRMQIFLDNISNFSGITNLKYITLAGEQLPLSLVHELHKLCGATVYNGYGPSETTVFSSLTKMNDELITIGKPLSNTQIYILDRYLKPVPIGIAGEIYISGDGVGKGYLNNAKLTGESFIENPFIPGTIMYKTGDIGMYASNGDILCLGRLDGQIKIRGLRIELGEIEALIAQYPNIKKVVVIKQIVNKSDCLSAYYVSPINITANELRKYLAEHLPKYMIPSYFVALDDLPYTPNGKIDKKALPLPSNILGSNETEYVPPKTELQKEIVEIFESILNTKPIGINDNFFELGGDSLLAMSLTIELQKISTNIAYSDLFHFSTVAEIEERINSKNTNDLMLKKIENLSDTYLEILNNCTKKDKRRKYNPKNVLITGCTGFLGIHILREFIENESGNIYCIVREKPGLTARARLHKKLNYYFGNKYDDLIDKRIFAITGDITEPGFGLSQDNLLELANSTDILINSAARVAHYGNYNDFYNSNVSSVKHMIDFCKTFNKKFYHISTISVGGLKMDLSYPAKRKKQKIEFDESSFYIGQNLDNVYARTKFKAEQYILEAMAQGLDAYIFRMGHLMPRFSDGVFQENILNNAVINRIISLVKIGAVPKNLLEFPLEFTPVDYAARAIYKIIKCPTNKNKIFILNNPHTFPAQKLVNISGKMEHPIKVLPQEEFSKEIKHILNNEETKHLINYLITDFDKKFNLDYNTGIKIKSNFTIKYLKKLHFKWPKISNKYLINFANLLWSVISNDRNK